MVTYKPHPLKPRPLTPGTSKLSVSSSCDTSHDSERVWSTNECSLAALEYSGSSDAIVGVVREGITLRDPSSLMREQ